jgi:hypothetical protein
LQQFVNTPVLGLLHRQPIERPRKEADPMALKIAAALVLPFGFVLLAAALFAHYAARRRNLPATPR